MRASGQVSRQAHVTVIEKRHCGLIFRVIEHAARLVALHHGFGLGAEHAPEAHLFADRMGDVGRAVCDDQGFEAVRIGERVFDTEPGAPGMAVKMNGAKAHRFAHGFGFAHIALERP